MGEDDQVRNPPSRADPAPSIRGALVEQEDILHVFAATKTTLPRAQVPLSWTESVFDLERSTHSLCNMGSTQALASAELRGQHPPPGSVETAPKCKTDEAFKEKVIYIEEYFRASRNLRFITWGTKPLILQSSHREGTDVFYGK